MMQKAESKTTHSLTSQTS